MGRLCVNIYHIVDFEWRNPESEYFDEKIILKMKDDQNTRYSFEVDFKYLKKLHDKHSDRLYCPENLTYKIIYNTV